MTRPFDPSSLLPELVVESTADEERAEIAELLAQLAAATAAEVEIEAAELAAVRARLLSSVASVSERFAPFFTRLLEFFELKAEALHEVFARAERESEWEPGPAPWISLLHFAGGPSLAGLDTGFVKFKKGSVFPPHRHAGRERVLILSGGYHDNEQRFFGPGDVHDMAIGTEHALQMTSDEDVWLAVIIEGEVQVLGAP